MKKLFLGAALFAFSVQAFGALPPYWDSVRKISTVLSSLELGERIYGDIKAVVAEDSNGFTYVVKTSECVARVTLDPHAPEHHGPTSYSIREVSNVACRSSN